MTGWIGLEFGILEEFDAAALCTSDERTELRESYRSIHLEEDRDHDRERKARMRAEALTLIREAEGIEERMCPVCGIVFPVEHCAGRPRIYCGTRHRVLSAVRRWREKRM